MPWGIAAAAVVGAGASVTGGLLQSGAAKDAAAAQQDAYNQGITTSLAGQRDALSYLDPYRNFGLTAGYAMTNALYSPEQLKHSTDSQRIALEGEIARLKSSIPQWDTYQTFTGKNASERRRDSFHAELNTIQTKIREAESKLATFNRQSELQLSQAQQMQGTRQAQPKQPVEASPWYQFQAELLGRTMDRHFAARGLSGSGFEAEEKRRGLIELGAGETERQYARMVGEEEREFAKLGMLFGAGLNSSVAGAGAITGTSQNVAGMQIGQGQAAANGLLRVGEANAGIATGIGNQLNSAAGLYLQNQQWNAFRDTLANRNNPRSYSSPDLVFNSVDSGGSYDYLRPTA
jgi:hypothetical protein